MDDLREIEAIKQLKYRYMRCLDQKRWDELAECLTPDVVTSYGGGKYAFEGRDAVMRFLSEAMEAPSFLSSHRVHHPEITLVDGATARGVWALEDTVVDPVRRFVLQGAAFYEDEYAKADGRWRIRRTGYQRTFEYVESFDQRPGLTITAGWPPVAD